MDPTKDVEASGTASEQQGDISNPRAEEEGKARVLRSLVRAGGQSCLARVVVKASVASWQWGNEEGAVTK